MAARRAALCLVACAALTAGAASGVVRAAQIEQLSVHYHGAVVMRLEAVLDAPVARVAALLENPHDLARLLPGAAAVDVLPGAPAGARRLRVELSGCLLFFCPTLTDVMDTRYRDGGFVGVTVPALSDFSAGRMSWRYTAAPGGGTLLRLNARLTPRLWVPPLIGPYLIEHKVENQMRDTVVRIERAARLGHLPPPHRPTPVNIPGFNF